LTHVIQFGTLNWSQRTEITNTSCRQQAHGLGHQSHNRRQADEYLSSCPSELASVLLDNCYKAAEKQTRFSQPRAAKHLQQINMHCSRRSATTQATDRYITRN